MGIARHQGLIPWDDDIDLCIDEESESKLLELKDLLLTYEFCLVKEPTFGYRIYHLNDSEELPGEN